jgi:hypothetical protein
VVDGNGGGVWRIRVDVGGTFSDCVGVWSESTDPQSRVSGTQRALRRVKVLSTGRVRLRVLGVSDVGAVRVDASGLPAGGLRGLIGGQARPLGVDDSSASRVMDADERSLVVDADGFAAWGEVGRS